MVKNENVEELKKTIYKSKDKITLDGIFYEHFNKLCTTVDGLTTYPRLSEVKLELSEFGQNVSEDVEELVFKVYKVEDNESLKILNDSVIRNSHVTGYLSLLFKNIFDQICKFLNNIINDFNFKKHIGEDAFIILSVTDVYYSQKEQTITCKYHKVVDKAVWGSVILTKK
jgi:hypothetical protein